MAGSQHTQTHPQKVVLPFVRPLAEEDMFKLDSLEYLIRREQRAMLNLFRQALEFAGVEYIEEEEQPKGFTWLFLGTYPGQKCRPAVLRAEASSEEEARQDLAQRMGDSWSFIFAAKIRQGCPLYRYSSGAFELDVQALAGVEHA